MSREEFSKTLFPNLDWEDKKDHLVNSPSDSNSFSTICAKLDGMSSVEELDEEDMIDLEGVSLTYRGFGDGDEVFTIKAIGDFTTDKYRVEIW